jgi:hypothetical protein
MFLQCHSYNARGCVELTSPLSSRDRSAPLPPHSRAVHLRRQGQLRFSENRLLSQQINEALKPFHPEPLKVARAAQSALRQRNFARTNVAKKP